MTNHRGSVGRAFHRISKYHTDPVYRKKVLERGKKYGKRYYLLCGKERGRERLQILNEFANIRCKKCNKLICYKSKTGLCREHYVPKGYTKKMRLKRKHENQM